jgi:spermidine/putrescine-binding protein
VPDPDDYNHLIQVGAECHSFFLTAFQDSHGKTARHLDKAQLPNPRNINPAYLNTDFDKGDKYSVPYTYTLALLGYNEKKMRELDISVDNAG